MANPFEEISSTLPEEPMGDATPAPPAKGPRYRTLSLLGEGGMGRVEEMFDRDLMRAVAAKTLHPDRKLSPSLLRQFLWEARVTAYLDHPNIVPVHDAGVTPSGTPFYTMKLVRGKTLHQALADLIALPDPNSSESLQRRLRWFLTTCHAVAYAHSRGVLHRDLKPSNILIGEFGEVLVSDWGLAIPLPEAPAALRPLMPDGIATGRAGTPGYMSPEQSRGEALDQRSDLFSLGIILRELLTGAEINRSLAAIINRATLPDREARYQGVTALIDDVEAVLAGRTPRAERASMTRQVWRRLWQPDSRSARLRQIFVASIQLAFIGAGMAMGGVIEAVPPRRPPWVLWVSVADLLLFVLAASELIRIERTIRREKGR